MYGLILLLFMQTPDFSMVPRNSTQVELPAQHVHIVSKRIYVVVDKFGTEHENEDKAKALKEAAEANEKPFRMKDSQGVEWLHPDKSSLEQFIRTRNLLIGPVGFVTQCPPGAIA